MDGTAPALEPIKAAMRAAWMAGDFGVVAKTIAGSAEAFVRRLNIPAGAKVLDVACGTGNLAIPLARQGCLVTGVDIAPNLIAQRESERLWRTSRRCSKRATRSRCPIIRSRLTQWSRCSERCSRRARRLWRRN
jgi:SAM-dependent methyltransferase